MLRTDSETSACRGWKMDGYYGYLSSFSTLYLFLDNFNFGLLDFFAVVKFLCDKSFILAANEDEEEDNGGGPSPFCFINKKDVKNI
ncbi:hypothetical protein HanRHA438_Chr05g0211631 [Helianthus annuus]|uniref:Uncharacterized protein n=1 Tax=Helianthus annuus TaxID=4232 RepID=A0A9K3NLD7_HELAN|nr:hypothetical protein HanXRQr2_Chr05g0201791 [Helianthus annuus]KAJ0583715.1 hypothetical protein HanHA89_Chr05g0179861 [Helianthus annuus]KAJ0746437.1 hypothetical protein HanOQP8_Chr05g0177601 [Helianthus annuus]KAJ0749444.1 hypothetical protein HanLR1_Chr05g0169941 [Helianthus annuus]KAJ0917922.1 hypothetical protein HanRHA438_Chr05g0211631 [Helianthus annuus]